MAKNSLPSVEEFLKLSYEERCAILEAMREAVNPKRRIEVAEKMGVKSVIVMN